MLSRAQIRVICQMIRQTIRRISDKCAPNDNRGQKRHSANHLRPYRVVRESRSLDPRSVWRCIGESHPLLCRSNVLTAALQVWSRRFGMIPRASLRWLVVSPHIPGNRRHETAATDLFCDFPGLSGTDSENVESAVAGRGLSADLQRRCSHLAPSLAFDPSSVDSRNSE